MIDLQTKPVPGADGTRDVVLVVSGDSRLPLAATLEDGGFDVVESDGSAGEALAAARTEPAAVVISLDPSVAATRTELRAFGQAAGDVAMIVVVPDATEHADLRETIAAGARGVLHESEVESALCATLAVIALGQVVLPRTFVRHFQKPVLSSREKQVLSLVVMGFSNAEIASRLFLAESTVKSHLSSAFNRLGVKSRKQATAMILDPESGLGAGILSILPVDEAERRAA
jgi:DNA-binding NarL/FixJ family response regulator